MAEPLSLHIDDDWKKQAQEEKRRLAEEEQKRAAEKPVVATPAAAPTAAGRVPTQAGGRAGTRELPEANFGTLVQSILTQGLFYLGELAYQGTEPMLNLDMAKHQHDYLATLEEKTRNNLNEDEQRLLDSALYELQTRYIAVASEMI